MYASSLGSHLGEAWNLLSRVSRVTRGVDGLRDVLAQQTIIGNDVDLIWALLPLVKLREFASGAELIRQGDSSNSIYFLLIGSVSIGINGRMVAARSAGDHMGEMAMVDPAVARTATVVATSACVLAEVSEPEIVAVAQAFPILWRRIAIVLSRRLREHERFDFRGFRSHD